MIKVTIDIKITCDECGLEMPVPDKEDCRVARLKRYYSLPIRYCNDWRIKFDRDDKVFKCFCPEHRPPERRRMMLGVEV